MDRIWAPWRMDYIESSKKPGCVFSEKSQSKKDKKNLVKQLELIGFHKKISIDGGIPVEFTDCILEYFS